MATCNTTTTTTYLVYSLCRYRLLRSVFSMYDTEKDGTLSEREVGAAIVAWLLAYKMPVSWLASFLPPRLA